jgi:hypothetical protein
MDIVILQQLKVDTDTVYPLIPTNRLIVDTVNPVIELIKLEKLD